MSTRARLTYWQESCLKSALIEPVRASRSPAIPSLVKRGMMRRLGGRPGHIYYGITDLGKQQLAHHLIDVTANKPTPTAQAQKEGDK